MVKFLNLVPWGGLYFCYRPGEVIDLPEETATAREAAGLGKLVIDKSKKAEPKVEPLAEVKGEATVGAPDVKIEPPKPSPPSPPPAPASTPSPAPPAAPAQAKPAV